MKSEAKRRYDDACGTAHGLELIGERWALLVLRELLLGPRRFSDLRADLPGISANVLTQRLTELEERGLVRRRKLPPPAATQVYEATEWGLEAEPIIQVLGRWAARSPLHDPTMPISATSIMLSLKTMADEKRAKGFEARIGFRLGEERFVGRMRKGRFKVARGESNGHGFHLHWRPATARRRHLRRCASRIRWDSREMRGWRGGSSPSSLCLPRPTPELNPSY